jgi:DNA-binding NarL/FixJ family response regulator
MRPRLLIADDHTLVVEGFRRLLEHDFDIVGEVEDGRALLTAAERLKPDVILLDIAMPLLNGIDAARQLKRSLPAARLLFITLHSDPDYVREAFRAGARGYILKRSAASELITAIHEVMKDRFYITPLVTREALGPLLDTGVKEKSRLTPRQREVLQLVSEGRSAKEIGAILHISKKTVEFHKSAIMEELSLHTTAELTRYALEHGLLGR